MVSCVVSSRPRARENGLRQRSRCYCRTSYREARRYAARRTRWIYVRTRTDPQSAQPGGLQGSLDRQTDRQTDGSRHCLMLPLPYSGGITSGVTRRQQPRQCRRPGGPNCNAVDCRLALEVQRWTRARSECLPGASVRENVCNNSKKRKNSRFLKSKKTLKNVKNADLPPKYSFTGRSITQPLILNYRNRNSVPVPVSHQHHTPCSEMRTQETNMQLTCRSMIVKRL